MTDNNAKEPTLAESAPAATTGDIPSAPPGYEMLDELGRGGMGVVYRARQVGLNRLVALKMILSGAYADAGEMARFRTEGQAIARLHHPGIVQVHEVGEHQGKPFFVLELCPAGGLDRKLAGSPLPPLEAAQLVRRLAEAMQVAHHANVVHRDLKPANVLFADDGAPRISDFGLAKKLDEQSQTLSGAVVGTPSYMAPEQAEGKKEVGPLADVYSLGAILYECLTGRPPFKAATVYETLLQVVNEEPVPVRQLNAAIPADLETICLKCLRKAPTQRYGSAGELAADLGRYLVGEPIHARPTSALERGVKWCRRRPGVALLLTALVWVTVVGFVTIWHLYSNVSWLYEEAVSEAERAGRAEQAAETLLTLANRDRDAARKAQQLADAERGRAEQQEELAEVRLYASRLQSAQREWEARRPPLAWAHLDACRWDFRHLEHRYLHTLFSQNGYSMTGHDHSVTSVAWSPNGQWILSGSMDKSVMVWDAQSGISTNTLFGHTESIGCVAWSPEEGRFASAGRDRTIHLWARVGDRWDRVRVCRGHTNEVTCLAYSPDGKFLVSGCHDSTLKVWDPKEGTAIRTFQGHGWPVQGVAWDPLGDRIASASGDGLVLLWNAKTGQELRSIVTDKAVQCLAWSPDGGRIAEGGGEFWATSGTARVWNANTGQLLHALKGHAGPVYTLGWSPDGTRIVTGDRQTVRVWNADTGKESLLLRGHGSTVRSVAFSPDGARIVSGSYDSNLTIWDARQNQDRQVLGDYPDGVSCVAISPDGTLIASGGFDRTVKVWAAGSRQLKQVLDSLPQYPKCLAFSPDGRHLACGYGELGKVGEVRVWSIDTGKTVHRLGGYSSTVRDLSWSPDGNHLATSNELPERKGNVRIWDARTGRETRNLPHNAWVVAVAYCPVGNRLAMGDSSGFVLICDASTGAVLHSHRGHQARVTRLAWARDGKRLASGGSDKDVLLWNGENGQIEFTLQGHTDEITGVAFTADGARVVSASLDRTLKFWSTKTGQDLLTATDTVLIDGLALSPQDNLIVTAGGKVVVLRSAHEADEMFYLAVRRGEMKQVAVQPDGKRLFTRDTGGKVRAWDGRTGQEVRFAGNVSAKFDTSAVSEDGKLQVRIQEGSVNVVRGASFAIIDKRQEDENQKFLRQLSRFDSLWHLSCLTEAEDAGDDFATEFHARLLLREQPWNLDVRLRLAHLAAEKKQVERATLQLARVLMLNPRAHLVPHDPGAARRGRQAAADGDWPRAARILRRAAGQPGADLLDDLLLTQCAAGVDCQATANQLLDRLARIKPGTRIQTADWLQAVPLDQESAKRLEAYTRQATPQLHGVALYRCGRYREAAQRFAAVGDKGPPETWLFQALTAKRLGQHREAEAFLNRYEAWHRRYRMSDWREQALHSALLAEGKRVVNTPPAMPPPD